MCCIGEFYTTSDIDMKFEDGVNICSDEAMLSFWESESN